MKMDKKKFRIGELADQLALERFVIRFWEKEFGIRPRRSSGGQRFYDESDLKKFETIKELLYNKKFTIAGAKDFLKKNKHKKTLETPEIIASHLTTLEPENCTKPSENNFETHVHAQLFQLREKLEKLRALLD